MININVRLPDDMHDQLVDIKYHTKVSINDQIIEAIKKQVMPKKK